MLVGNWRVGEIQVPSYTPYMCPGISEAPWIIPTSEHTDAITRWKANRQANRANKPQLLPQNAWILYRTRFIFTDDILCAWSPFGGLAAQLNHLSIVLQIATTESAAAAFTYGPLLPVHLEDLARSRAEITTTTSDFPSLFSVQRPRFKLQAAAQSAKAPHMARLSRLDPPPHDKKAKRTWLARREHLSKMEEGRAKRETEDNMPSDPRRISVKRSAKRSRPHT